jgi:hypothetical protein
MSQRLPYIKRRRVSWHMTRNAALLEREPLTQLWTALEALSAEADTLSECNPGNQKWQSAATMLQKTISEALDLISSNSNSDINTQFCSEVSKQVTKLETELERLQILCGNNAVSTSGLQSPMVRVSCATKAFNEVNRQAFIVVQNNSP